ncbi:MAG: hypothetical protein FWD97_01050 [Defluviitaleaceae bacterium]|nr:hypothetical protein [Defluviitaleaceae bacterium]
MFITLTIKTSTHQADIRIDHQQKISEGLKVLRESGRIPKGYTPDFFRSCVRETLVSAYKTFKEEGIFDGDILIAIEPELESKSPPEPFGEILRNMV